MSSGRKSITSYYSKVAPKTILEGRDFLIAPGLQRNRKLVSARRRDFVALNFEAGMAFSSEGLPRMHLGSDC
jgi:hypothetical protein